MITFTVTPHFWGEAVTLPFWRCPKSCRIPAGKGAILAAHRISNFFFVRECRFSGCVLFKCEVKMGGDKGQGENAKGKRPAFFALPYSHIGYIYFALLKLSSQPLVLIS